MSVTGEGGGTVAKASVTVGDVCRDCDEPLLRSLSCQKTLWKLRRVSFEDKNGSETFCRRQNSIGVGVRRIFREQ